MVPPPTSTLANVTEDPSLNVVVTFSPSGVKLAGIVGVHVSWACVPSTPVKSAIQV